MLVSMLANYGCTKTLLREEERDFYLYFFSRFNAAHNFCVTLLPSVLAFYSDESFFYSVANKLTPNQGIHFIRKVREMKWNEM